MMRKKAAAKPKTAPVRKAPRKTAAAKAAPAAAPSKGSEVCPRCGTDKFGPEERTRVDGRRTVRFTVLVCERGHTFAHPVVKQA